MPEKTTEIEDYLNTIDGVRVPSASGKFIESHYPFTGRAWARIPRCSEADIDGAVEAAHRAFTSGDWPGLTPTARGKLLRKLGDLITDNAEQLAELEVLDNGKLIAEMALQVRYVPEWFYYFGGLADKIEGSVIPVDKPDMFNYTRHEPLGVIACISFPGMHLCSC